LENDLKPEWFTYDAGTGELRWKERPLSDFAGGTYTPERRAKRWNARYAGKVAGIVHRGGYLRVKSTYVHRLIWEMHNGPIPEGMQIDHVSGDRADNRLGNLRLATPKQNAQNKRARRCSTSPFVGVSWSSDKQKWVAQINANGVNRYLGAYEKQTDAAAAYNVAARATYGAFANINQV
jgi:hypothetical protein